MGTRRPLPLFGWPVARQLVDGDRLGLGSASTSARTEALRPRTERADRVVRSVCPYCAVGCGQLVYVEDERAPGGAVARSRIVDIEGDPDSPISAGCLCPKGAATFQLVTGAHRVHDVLYRAPGATAWQTLPLERAMDMIAARVQRARDDHWIEEQPAKEGGPPRKVRHTRAIAHLGGATLDNEENYLIKKLFTALGIVQVENQARI